jgi:hypothetical protein
VEQEHLVDPFDGRGRDDTECITYHIIYMYIYIISYNALYIYRVQEDLVDPFDGRGRDDTESIIYHIIYVYIYNIV